MELENCKIWLLYNGADKTLSFLGKRTSIYSINIYYRVRKSSPIGVYFKPEGPSSSPHILHVD
jgi:hypothetical protein